MKFEFSTVEEYDLLWASVHDSILFWKKVLQDAQGKITLNVDGTHTHHSIQHALDRMEAYAELLVEIEDTPHIEWDGDKFVHVDRVESYSSIITKTLRQVDRNKLSYEEDLHNLMHRDGEVDTDN